MWGPRILLIVGLFAGVAHVSAAELGTVADVRHVSGELVSMDVKLGKLQLRADAPTGTQETTEYRITEHETRVTDPSDKQFLALKDLRAGQRVTIELSNSPGEAIARKITVESTPAPVVEEASGELESVDLASGTIVLDEKPGTEKEGHNLSYFVFDANDIVVMQSPSQQSVRLELKPDDRIKIAFVVADGKRHVRSITLYPTTPRATQ